MQISAKPLTVTDLIEGSYYLWMQVHHNGVMILALISVLKKPVDGDDYLIEYVYDCGKYHRRVKQHEFDGTGKEPSLFPNYSRIFASDDSLFDRLYKLAFYQKLDSWLEYLGVENPDEVCASLVQNRLRFDNATPVATYLPGRPVALDDGGQVFEDDYADLRPPVDQPSGLFRPELRERISHSGPAPTQLQ